MTMPATTDAKREELVQVARLCGENLSRRAFGERGPGLNGVQSAYSRQTWAFRGGAAC